MPSIKKNKYGTYSATIYVGRNSEGKMLRKYITRDSWHECKKAADAIEEETKSEGDLAFMKMSDYMDKWLEINKSSLANTTIRAYKMYIEYHFKPYFKELRVNQITDMHIKEYISLKLKTLCSTTVRKHFFTLSKMFRDVLKDKSPCANIKPPKLHDFQPTVPTEKEFKKIYNTFKKISIQDETIILLAGWCGLRRGEIFALKWDDINQKDSMIRIDEAVAHNEKGYSFSFKSPKSSNGIRTIVAPDYLFELFKKIKQSIPSKKGSIDISPKIFTENPDSFTKKYEKVMKSINLSQIRFHDLRHYHASLLYKNHVPDLYAAERLGHDILVLKKIYQHLGLEETKEIDQKVKKIFKK